MLEVVMQAFSCEEEDVGLWKRGGGVMERWEGRGGGQITRRALLPQKHPNKALPFTNDVRHSLHKFPEGSHVPKFPEGAHVHLSLLSSKKQDTYNAR